MNWMVPQLSDKTIVSFSDAHSLPKLGREVTVFDAPLSYSGLSQALAENLVAYTAEFSRRRANTTMMVTASVAFRNIRRDGPPGYCLPGLR